MRVTNRLLAERLLELVEIPSPSRCEERLAQHIEQFLRERSEPSELRKHGAAVVARYGCEPVRRGPRVGLIGHLDTVPEAGHPAPKIENDAVVGLGTSDMKGALAVMLTIAEGYDRACVPLALVFYDREEVGYDENGLGPLFEKEPWLSDLDLAVLMEPTDNQLELGCLGNLHARVTFTGTAAHSARPWLGENAIHKSGRFLVDLSAREPRTFTDGPALYREVLTATMAEGGVGRNVVPDRFTLTVNFRFAPDRTLAEAEAFLREQLPAGARVEITDRAPAAPARSESAVVQTLVRRFGLEARAKQAWTDVARFAAVGVPAFNFGPGLPEYAHKVDERIPIENLIRSFLILQSFLREGAGEAR